MIKHPISQLQVKTLRMPMQNIILAHTKTCPMTQQTKVYPGSGTFNIRVPNFKRAERSAPCRFGFIPENWFLYFYSKTGVTGPYTFGIVLGSYMLSKEIFVLEHEYYSGLSVALVLYLAVTKFGPEFGASLDKEVDKVQAAWEKGRQDEINIYEIIVKNSKEAQWRAEGQKMLMDAKKECVAMQLEIAYRGRLMEVYDAVKGRMDYQIKKCSIEKRLHQAWLVDWILENVYESITPELQKQCLVQAIEDLATAKRI